MPSPRTVSERRVYPLQNNRQHGKLLTEFVERSLLAGSRFTDKSVTSERCESGRIGQSRKLLSG